ncbi:MAG: zf-TFIIB domain-containing protein [bacterium]
MDCPKCKVTMLVVEYEGVELDYCLQCEGTWFDQGELALLFEDLGASEFGPHPEQLDALPEAKTREKKRKCPACDKKMRKVTVGPQNNVLIDACPRQHGLWFDGEEVAELAQQVVDAGSDLSDKAVAFMGRVFHKQDSSTEAEGEK